MEQTTIHSMPSEILEKIIIPFGDKPIQHMICKGWFDISQKLVAKSFSDHKILFESTLAEIRSINYEITVSFCENTIIFYYPDATTADELVSTTRFCISSMRQYKNKATTYRLVTNLIHSNKLIVNKIEMVKFTVQSLYYDYVDDLNSYNVPTVKQLKVIQQGPYYKFNMKAIDRCGLSYGDFINFEENGLKKSLSFNIVNLYQNEFTKEEFYTIYYCPISSPY